MTGGRALVITALLLASAGAMRLGSGVGSALARVPDPTPAVTAEATPAICPPPPAALVEALRQREAQIVTQEAALAERRAALDLAAQAIDARLAELSSAEARLSDTLARADGASENDLARLTAVYEAMKPKDAAALFTQMEPDFAAGFVGRMKPEAAGAVMAGMPSDTAYAISLLLAGRNALVPKE
ncbi:MotE family protein [Falsirhodobacter sp. 20TX0035]|uniref:MotE family protein n=1 Tax=Falsirhodobacter sp. 20TX0035 TaxID=3022019 RepID=UPI002330D80B|nr:hypothetical protein [Falsirhodobacter sp. 20TX0035]MDB6452474.1 hypothetical protein [Falsirhodobacter sp. 20TX0035]